MSELLATMVVVAVLFVELPSLVAPVVPLTTELPDVVGVPETVQVMLAPAATAAGVAGTQTVESPAGKPLTAHVAAVAAKMGAAPFEQV